MAPLIVIPLIVTLLEYQAIYLPPERRVDSGRVGQWMGGMQRRQWRLEQEHLLGLKEQQLHLPPAFRLQSSFYKDLARANWFLIFHTTSIKFDYLCMDGYQVGGRPRRGRMSCREHRNVHSFLAACSPGGSSTITSTWCAVTASGRIRVVSGVDCSHHAGKARLADACL